MFNPLHSVFSRLTTVDRNTPRNTNAYRGVVEKLRDNRYCFLALSILLKSSLDLTLENQLLAQKYFEEVGLSFPQVHKLLWLVNHKGVLMK